MLYSTIILSNKISSIYSCLLAYNDISYAYMLIQRCMRINPEVHRSDLLPIMKSMNKNTTMQLFGNLYNT